MDKYQNSKIYKLVNLKSGLEYIGSTTQLLSKRKAEHTRGYKRWCENPISFTSSYVLFEEEGNVEIYLIEDYPCKNRNELHAREGYWIQKHQNCVNINIPNGLSIEEYNKEYREVNKKEIREYKKEYYENNKEQLKEYYEQNKEKTKEYYENNKEKIKEYGKVKCSCSCGSNCYQGDISNHIKTKKHQHFLDSSKTAVLILVG